MDTTNKFAVGTTDAGTKIVVFRGTPLLTGISVDEAINVCAYLASLITVAGKKDELEKLYDEIMKT